MGDLSSDFFDPCLSMMLPVSFCLSGGVRPQRLAELRVSTRRGSEPCDSARQPSSESPEGMCYRLNNTQKQCRLVPEVLSSCRSFTCADSSGVGSWLRGAASPAAFSFCGARHSFGSIHIGTVNCEWHVSTECSLLPR